MAIKFLKKYKQEYYTYGALNTFEITIKAATTWLAIILRPVSLFSRVSLSFIS